MRQTIVLQRLLWTCVYLTSIAQTVYMIVTLWDKFLIHPTVTTLVSSTHPVINVPFPGVSVCSINKISKRRAQSIALQIANKTKRDSLDILNYIRFIGRLYDFDFEPKMISQLLEFQNILDVSETDIIDLIRNIATPCEQLLRSCYWRNTQVDCSLLFLLRVTHQGYCCVFNYAKRTQEFLTNSNHGNPLTSDAGVTNGLYLSVNNHLWDYYYTTLSAPGVMVLIFVPTDYPDKASGGVTEILTQSNSENFIEIIPTTFTSVPDVARYPAEKRRCLFDYERTTSFRSDYSSSDCNVDCRITSIQAMCQCIPFMIPFSNSSTVCTLADIPCLFRYKDKWNSFFPDTDVGPFLERERQDALRCDEQCYSSCDETIYETLVNSFPILNKTQTEQNITHIHVYFSNRFSKLYRQDVVYYWFEVLSNFGGIFGIFIGWSLISMVQFLYYYTKTVAAKLMLIQ